MIINFTATDTNASINKLNQSINNFINLSENTWQTTSGELIRDTAFDVIFYTVYVAKYDLG